MDDAEKHLGYINENQELEKQIRDLNKLTLREKEIVK